MKIDVKHIAKLAELHLNPDEEEKFEKQLEETLDYIEKLNEVNTKDVSPASQVTGLENVTREDEPFPSLSQEEATKNGNSVHNGFFKVPGILED